MARSPTPRVVRANAAARVRSRGAVNAVKRWRFEPVDAPVTTRRTIGFKPGAEPRVADRKRNEKARHAGLFPFYPRLDRRASPGSRRLHQPEIASFSWR
jgi:hypothetical protein